MFKITQDTNCTNNTKIAYIHEIDDYQQLILYFLVSCVILNIIYKQRKNAAIRTDNTVSARSGSITRITASSDLITNTGSIT